MFKSLISFRFGSGLSKIHRFGSVRRTILAGSMRFGLRFSDASWLRFGSVRFRVRFRSVPELNGSVRFGSARPVQLDFVFLPEKALTYGSSALKSAPKSRIRVGVIQTGPHFGRGTPLAGRSFWSIRSIFRADFSIRPILNQNLTPIS